ncbi:MAG: hypothetical protein RBT73_11010 [Spirochaetia bacterium]|jgi:hypothetical protein|nr:hypothetical protein [Spirochaetia bacterium]
MATFLERSLPFKSDLIEYWSPPSDTLRRGNGDCEDLAILFLTLMREETGVEGTLIIMHYPGPGEGILHAEAEFERTRFFALRPPRAGTLVARIPLSLALRITEESRPRGVTALRYSEKTLYYDDKPLPK